MSKTKFEIDPVLDANGEVAPENEDHLAAAEEPVKVLIPYGQRTFMAWIRPLDVPGPLKNRVASVGIRHAMKAGFKRDEMDKIGEDADLMEDPRYLAMVELQSESVELKRAQAAIAAAATARDEKSKKPLTNIGVFGADISEEIIMNAGGIGEVYTEIVNNNLRPTSEPGAEETPKTKAPSIPAS